MSELREDNYYHSDHLGSASWITDGLGAAVQHLQYLPYGEPFVDQRTAGYAERFTFTGKELAMAGVPAAGGRATLMVRAFLEMTPQPMYWAEQLDAACELEITDILGTTSNSLNWSDLPIQNMDVRNYSFRSVIVTRARQCVKYEPISQ